MQYVAGEAGGVLFRVVPRCSSRWNRQNRWCAYVLGVFYVFVPLFHKYIYTPQSKILCLQCKPCNDCKPTRLSAGAYIRGTWNKTDKFSPNTLILNRFHAYFLTEQNPILRNTTRNRQTHENRPRILSLMW